jgi:hypothetical protein
MITGHEKGIYRCTAPGDSLPITAHITYMRWVSEGAAAGDHCTVRERDGLGTIIFPSIADGANFLDVMALKRWCHGFYVDELDSGEVYVYTT